MDNLIVVSIDQSVISQAISFVQNKYIGHQMELIYHFPYLKSFTKITLLKLINNLKREDYTRNTLLFKQGDPFTHFFLIMHGEFDQTWMKQKKELDELRSVKMSYMVNQSNA